MNNVSPCLSDEKKKSFFERSQIQFVFMWYFSVFSGLPFASERKLQCIVLQLKKAFYTVR